MTTSLENEIRSLLAATVGGQVSLRDFDEWFTSETWHADLTENA